MPIHGAFIKGMNRSLIRPRLNAAATMNFIYLRSCFCNIETRNNQKLDEYQRRSVASTLFLSDFYMYLKS